MFLSRQTFSLGYSHSVRSYTRHFCRITANLLRGISKVCSRLPSLPPNLDSGFAIHDTFYCGDDPTDALVSDRVSTYPCISWTITTRLDCSFSAVSSKGIPLRLATVLSVYSRHGVNHSSPSYSINRQRLLNCQCSQVGITIITNFWLEVKFSFLNFRENFWTSLSTWYN